MKYTCPCCGYKTLTEPIGSYDICPICFWEDDSIQFENPFMSSGANHVSLYEGQRNFEDFESCEKEMLQHTRKPKSIDVLDNKWSKVELPEYMSIVVEYNFDLSKDFKAIIKEILILLNFESKTYSSFKEIESSNKGHLPGVIIFNNWFEFEKEYFRESKWLKDYIDDYSIDYQPLKPKVIYN